MKPDCRCLILLAALFAFGGSGLFAQVVPEKAPLVHEKEFRHPDLTIPAFLQSVGELPALEAGQARARLRQLDVAEGSARVDKRSGRFVTLLPATPMIPGAGIGNDLTWGKAATAGPPAPAVVEEAAWTAFRGFLQAHQQELGISLAELGPHRIASHGNGDLVQIWIPRRIKGVPVRDSYVSAVIGQGNLTLMSAHQWGDLGLSSGQARLTSEDALQASVEFLEPLRVDREWGKTELTYVPMARGQVPGEVGFAQGYRYRLAWSVKVEVDGDLGHWEVLVDARTGEVLANQDMNHYAEAKGGVYPVTNDGVVPDGVEQAGWPMPWLN
ncbi:MAG: PepSY domain-containing protein, partial [Acidobacteria bacterium]|nr:PepSY domain-containing protein [Acidobacteriota bacterium]